MSEKTMAMGISVKGPYFVTTQGVRRGTFDALEDARSFVDTLLKSIPEGQVIEIWDSKDYIERHLYPASSIYIT